MADFMNKRIIIIFTLLSVALISWQWGHTESPAKKFEEELPHAIYGLVLYDATADKILLDHLSDRYFTPASITKLFTAERALKKFGKDHRFETELLINGSISDSILQGDVILKGGGDPLFDDDGLIHFAKTLAEMGIKQIEGSILVKDPSYIHPHTEVSDMVHPYYCKYSLMNLNRNSHLIHFIPAAPGEEAIASPNAFECHVLTAKGDEEFELPEVKTTFFDPITRIEGTIKDSFDLRVPAYNLPEFISEHFKNKLAEFGIEVLDKEGTRVEPFKLTGHYSKPLGFLIGELLKNSDNLIGWVLNLQVAHEGHILHDGAGLSRHNKVTPAEVLDLLKKEGAIIDPYLPVAGVEGSLRKRLKETFLDKKLLAKTGGMEGINNLAGFWINSKGHKMILVFMMNQAPKPWKETCKAVDSFLGSILKEYD